MTPLFARLAALWAVLSPVAASSATPEILLSEFGGNRSSWSGFDVESGPGDASQPVLRWDVPTRKAIDSPRFPKDWRSFDELRFEVLLEAPKDFTLSVLFIADHGYYHTRLALDWSGWKEVRIRLADCHQAYPEASWETVQSFGFRAQGYNQGPIPEYLVLRFRNFRLHAPAPLPFSNLAEWTIAGRHKELNLLKQQGNPYHAAVLSGLETAPPPPAADAEVTSAWTFAGHSGRALAAAWAASWEKSPRRGDPKLIERSCGFIDFCLSRQRDGSWFYSQKWTSGDPNSDRFALAPLMDAIHWLRALPEGRKCWPKWEASLRQLVDFQYTRWACHKKLGFEKNEAWGQAALTYPNQDVFHLVEMALAYEFWNDTRFRESASETLRSLEANLLPDGGFHYIGPETECDIYHSVNLVWIARYFLLTNDTRARDLLKRTAPYYPLTSSNEAWPEYYTDCWWKHYWADGRAAGPEIVAGIAEDSSNRWLAERLLERVGPGDFEDAITAGMFYRADLQPRPLPDNWLRMDCNIRGPRGRFGDWYFAATPGGGARDTFVGAMISRPDHLLPLRGAFLAANVEVGLSAGSPRQSCCLYVSGPDDITATAIEGDAAAIATRYTLRKPYINSVRNPRVAPTPWRGTQLWILTRHGLVGQLELEATERQDIAFLGGELRFGPDLPLATLGEGHYRCGDLSIRILDRNLPELTAGPARPGYAQAETRHQAITLRTAGDRFTAEPGKPVFFRAVIAPNEAAERSVTLATTMEPQSTALRILRATIAGKSYQLAFNPTDQPAPAPSWDPQGGPIPPAGIRFRPD